MKKIIAVLMSALVLIGFSACGNQAVEETEAPKRESTEPLDPEIIGSWSNGTTGYSFKDDRHVSLIMNQSDYVHFDGDSLIVNGQTLTKDTIEFDGNEFRAYYAYESQETGEKSEMDILLMTKIGNPSHDKYDGVYKITGGVVQESVGESLAKTVSKTLDEMNLTVEVKGDSFIVTVNDYCWYETINGVLSLFDDNMTYVDPNADSLNYNYSINNDELTMLYFSSIQGASVDKEIYKKVK